MMHRPTTHLLYLHGFRSSPQSMKAQKMALLVASRYPKVTFWCPQLPPSPKHAMALVAQGLQGWPQGDAGGGGRMAVMGSSLGGFYATWVAERVPQAAHAPVVLINPAVHAARDLARHIGEHTAWHDPQERFVFTAAHADELSALEVGPLSHPRRYQVWAATGDEVLDHREMQCRYQACGPAGTVGDWGGVHTVNGSDHALSDFEEHLPAMLGHLNFWV